MPCQTDAPMPFLAIDDRMPERVSVTLAVEAVIEDACRRPLCSIRALALAGTGASAHVADTIGRTFPEAPIHDAVLQRMALVAAFKLGIDIGQGSDVGSPTLAGG